MLEAMKEQIQTVAECRFEAQRAAQAKRVAEEAWRQENGELFAKADLTKQVTEEAEDKLRELILEHYAKTGDKKPLPGLGVREMKRLEYETATAYSWALEHKMALKLDIKAFEKICLVSLPEFVGIHIEPQATIAKELPINKEE